ncbi:hypothetical protein HNP48_001546 [Acidovorax soli]|uniref:DUF3472 domain-containing protein n=1 Tax=Acidovorax soli TaxID=592050 RepID=A0A7X0PBK0_9BURK|nr:DUF3472 domain-containing protein [Acidovorax soli]MBB6558882.1 hypothetical protein [Acidovorax soli]
MKKVFLSLFAAVASLASQAQPMAVPIHTQIAEHYFEDQSPASMMEVDVNWETAPATGWGSYAQFYTRFQAGERSGAYMGLQQDDRDGKKIIFSMWDASASHKVRPYALPHCQRFSHEGNGAMCIMKFQWKPGVKYKLVMGIIPAKTGDVGFTRWGGWLVDSAGVETFIGGYEVPDYNGLKGVGGLLPANILMVMEYYLAPSNVQCSSLPQQSLTWSGLRVNGSRAPKNVYARYQTFLSDCVYSEYVRSYSKGSDSITQTTNVLNAPRANEGAFLWTSSVTPVPTTPTTPAPTPTTPVVTTPSGDKMSAAFRQQVVCTYGRVIRHFKDHFAAALPIREYVSDITYQIGYPEDQWGKNGSLVAALAYVHSEGQMTVVWADGTRQNFGPIGDWISAAGC